MTQPVPLAGEDARDRSPASVTGLALLQWLAVISMLVDHLGVVSILGDWSRIAGRFALPAFVVMVACNALSTASPGRMASRCAVLLLVSQPLWWLSVGTWDLLCILVTLLAVILMVWAFRVPGPLGFLSFLLVTFVFTAVSPWVEYSFWPLLLVPVVIWPSFPMLLLALVWPFFQYLGQPLFQASALFSLLVVLYLVRFPFNVPRLPRMLSRYFYPLHLGLIGLSKTII